MNKLNPITLTGTTITGKPKFPELEQLVELGLLPLDAMHIYCRCFQDFYLTVALVGLAKISMMEKGNLGDLAMEIERLIDNPKKLKAAQKLMRQRVKK